MWVSRRRLPTIGFVIDNDLEERLPRSAHPVLSSLPITPVMMMPVAMMIIMMLPMVPMVSVVMTVIPICL